MHEPGRQTQPGTVRRLVLGVALALGVLVGLVACGGGGEDEFSANGEEEPPAAERPVRTFEPDTTMARLQERGEIVVGVKLDAPPFGFNNPETDEYSGFDITLARRIAQELGVQPRFVEAVSDDRIPFLREGTVDLILSTFTITSERDREIDFSTPYYVARGRILVPGDSDIDELGDLAGRRVCTALGSTYEDMLHSRAPRADVRLVDAYSECMALVQSGAVDAVVTDDVILTGMIIQDDSLRLVGDDLTLEPYGAGLREGDPAFQAFVSDVIEGWKADGGWAAAYERWVGRYTGEEQRPPAITLERALELN